uniref:hypothetical protein n=1 Tax=Arcobacter sp. TaxID=1872629 RepID=UPI003D1102B2
MMTLVLKHQDGSQETIKVDKNMSFSPKAGEQFYIDNSSGSKYTLNLVNGDSSVQLVFNTEPKIKLVFDGIVDLIKANDVENKTVLSVLNDSEGIKNLEQTVLNTEFKSDDVISSLRDLLNEGLATVDKVHGVIIDDFGSLTEALASAAAGGPTGDGSTTPSFTLDVPDTTFGGLGDRTLGTRTSRDFTSLNNTGTTVNTTITDATSEGDNGAGTNDVTTVVDDTATTNEDAAINIDVIANDTDVDSKSPVATVTQGANG